MIIFSIVGVVISSIGVCLSLLLFNASINNQRKIIYNDLIYLIQTKLFYAFNLLVTEQERIDYLDEFDRHIFRIHNELNKISFEEDIELPLIPRSIKYKDDKATQKFDFNKGLDKIVEYFAERNIHNVDLLFDYYQGRFDMQQVFHQKIHYKRKFL